MSTRLPAQMRTDVKQALIAMKDADPEAWKAHMRLIFGEQLFQEVFPGCGIRP